MLQFSGAGTLFNQSSSVNLRRQSHVDRSAQAQQRVDAMPVSFSTVLLLLMLYLDSAFTLSSGCESGYNEFSSTYRFTINGSDAEQPTGCWAAACTGYSYEHSKIMYYGYMVDEVILHDWPQGDLPCNAGNMSSQYDFKQPPNFTANNQIVLDGYTWGLVVPSQSTSRSKVVGQIFCENTAQAKIYFNCIDTRAKVTLRQYSNFDTLQVLVTSADVIGALAVSCALYFKCIKPCLENRRKEKRAMNIVAAQENTYLLREIAASREPQTATKDDEISIDIHDVNHADSENNSRFNRR